MQIDEDWRGDLQTVGGIEEGGLRTTTGSPDDAAAGGKNNHRWEGMIASNGVHASDKILNNVCYVGIVYQSLKEQRRLGLKISTEV